jgi:hypothetical protein
VRSGREVHRDGHGKTANPDFLRPTVFSGDFQQPEQRIGQIGFRFSF